jgi:hypothetical protein
MMKVGSLRRKDLRILQRIDFEEKHGEAQRQDILRASLTFGRR